LASPPAPEGIAAALAPVLGAAVAVDGLRRLTSGASRETWSFRANGEVMILRRDPPGRPGAPGSMRREAHAMRACTAAGLRAPEVLVVDDDGDDFGTPGLVMRRVEGETIPRRILRDDRYAAARAVLVGDLAEFLAGFHRVDPVAVPEADEVDLMARVRELSERVGVERPVFAKAEEWLIAHRPPPIEPVLVHGDFRLGNVIVDDDGLAAVIDWELVHRGDHHEDLAYLCMKAWRFGGPGEAAGLETQHELVDRYEAAGGPPVDQDRFHWWLVQRTLTWGIGCLLQADMHLSGRVRSLDLAAVGRRAVEQEWDLIELLAPEACVAARAAPAPVPEPDTPGRHGRPTARELLEAVAEFLDRDVVTSVDPAVAYQGRVAANVLRIVDRELAQPVPPRAGDDWITLALDVRDRLAVSSPGHLAM
jgi:aminoglycoside phosphotransferase (APT) family kinase protein